jgi:hypothetical protein
VTRRLAWALWAVAMLGLVLVVWFDQLVRRAGRPDLVVVTLDAVPPLVGAVSTATVGRCWPAAGPATRWAGCCWPSVCA